MAGSYVLSGRVAEAGLSHLHELVERVRGDHSDLDETELLLLETALVEVAGNAVEHGTPPGGIRYELVVDVADDGLRATFTDDGDAVVLPADQSMPLDPLAESGRGLALARAALTELRYERQGDRNVWFLIRLDGARATSTR